MVKQITFKVKHDPKDPSELRIAGKGSCANVKLRREAGWYIPDVDYTVTWKVSARGIWRVRAGNRDMIVGLVGRETYQVCKFPTEWMGKKLTRTVTVVQ
jgi:hypothetical protein